jgi:hypothetical protein
MKDVQRGGGGLLPVRQWLTFFGAMVSVAVGTLAHEARRGGVEA